MGVNTPTLAVAGRVRYDSPQEENKSALDAGLEGVTRYDPQEVSMTPGQLGVSVTPASSPASYLKIAVNRPIRFRINGGTEDFYVERLLLWVGTGAGLPSPTGITSLELFNDQLVTPKGVDVHIVFASGGDII